MTQKYLLIMLFLLPSLTWGADLRGRLGVGLSNQLANGLPAISMKLQSSKTFAVGAILGLRADEAGTNYGTGIKLYRIIFDEPQLNFYLAGLFASENYLTTADKLEQGYQVDGTMGTEFHFTGLESLGFSVEFGLSLRKGDDQGGSSFETLGDNFLKAGVHFYL